MSLKCRSPPPKFEMLPTSLVMFNVRDQRGLYPLISLSYVSVELGDLPLGAYPKDNSTTQYLSLKTWGRFSELKSICNLNYKNSLKIIESHEGITVN